MTGDVDGTADEVRLEFNFCKLRPVGRGVHAAATGWDGGVAMGKHDETRDVDRMLAKFTAEAAPAGTPPADQRDRERKAIARLIQAWSRVIGNGPVNTSPWLYTAVLAGAGFPLVITTRSGLRYTVPGPDHVTAFDEDRSTLVLTIPGKGVTVLALAAIESFHVETGPAA